MKVRTGEREDASFLWSIRTAAITELCARAYPQEVIAAWAATPMPLSFSDLVAGPNCRILEANGTPVAFGVVDLKRSLLEALFVSPEHVGRGVGRLLLEALEAVALEEGVTRLRLESSLNAVSFYRRAGYADERPSTFRHPAGFELPCLQMEKVLVPPPRGR